jgi:hypothetical protein
MTHEDIHMLAWRATEHHMADMHTYFEQQNGHPFGGYPLQYMGMPQRTYVELFPTMQPWHLQDTFPERHITQG